MQSYLIRDVTVFDGERLQPWRSVRITDGVIAEVDDAVVRLDDVVIEGENGTVLPGLIDSHTHVFDGGQAQALQFGVTTLIDLFCDPPRLARYRRDAANRLDVSDIRSAGIGATSTGGHPSHMAPAVYDPFPTVASSREAQAFVDTRISEGSQFLKIFIEDGRYIGHEQMPMLDADCVSELVRAAHARGIKAIAHATSLAAATRALDANVDGLAHVVVDQIPDDAFIARLRTTNTFVVTTLTMIDWLCGSAQRDEYLADEESLRLLSPARLASLRAMPDSDVDMTLANHPSIDVAMRVAKKLCDAGVTILAGTDGGALGPEGMTLHRELRRLVDAGLSCSQALATATSAPADAFALADRGRIARGLRGDVVLVDGDLMSDIVNVKRVREVWRSGLKVERDRYARPPIAT